MRNDFRSISTEGTRFGVSKSSTVALGTIVCLNYVFLSFMLNLTLLKLALFLSMKFTPDGRLSLIESEFN